MWLKAIKDLYTGVKAQFLYSGSLSGSFDIAQGKRQGRILAPFMYKVYINSLPHVLSDHNYALCIRSLQLTSPSFVDDIILLALHPSFLNVFMDMCHQYDIKWRYEFNHPKWGSSHSKDIVGEVYKYKNLGILKNCVGLFAPT